MACIGEGRAGEGVGGGGAQVRTESLEATGSVESLSLGLVPSSLLVRVTSGVSGCGASPTVFSVSSPNCFCASSPRPWSAEGGPAPTSDYSLRLRTLMSPVSTAHNLRSRVFQSS